MKNTVRGLEPLETWIEIKELLGETNMDELLEIVSRIEEVKTLHGEDIAFRALARAIVRVKADPSFFGVGPELPPAGNECGIHTQYTGIVAKIRNRQNERT